jgi:hypothetical protein
MEIIGLLFLLQYNLEQINMLENTFINLFTHSTFILIIQIVIFLYFKK